MPVLTLEENREKLLSEIKEEQLDKPWTPEASEIVAIIDEANHDKT